MVDQSLKSGHPHKTAKLAACIEETDRRCEGSPVEVPKSDQGDRQKQETETETT